MNITCKYIFSAFDFTDFLKYSLKLSPEVLTAQ